MYTIKPSTLNVLTPADLPFVCCRYPPKALLFFLKYHVVMAIIYDLNASCGPEPYALLNLVIQKYYIHVSCYNQFKIILLFTTGLIRVYMDPCVHTSVCLCVCLDPYLSHFWYEFINFGHDDGLCMMWDLCP